MRKDLLHLPWYVRSSSAKLCEFILVPGQINIWSMVEIIIGIVSIFVAEWQMGSVWGGILQKTATPVSLNLNEDQFHYEAIHPISIPTPTPPPKKRRRKGINFGPLHIFIVYLQTLGPRQRL